MNIVTTLTIAIATHQLIRIIIASYMRMRKTNYIQCGIAAGEHKLAQALQRMATTSTECLGICEISRSKRIRKREIGLRVACAVKHIYTAIWLYTLVASQLRSYVQKTGKNPCIF